MLLFISVSLENFSINSAIASRVARLMDLGTEGELDKVAPTLAQLWGLERP